MVIFQYLSMYHLGLTIVGSNCFHINSSRLLNTVIPPHVSLCFTIFSLMGFVLHQSSQLNWNMKIMKCSREVDKVK